MVVRDAGLAEGRDVRDAEGDWVGAHVHDLADVALVASVDAGLDAELRPGHGGAEAGGAVIGVLARAPDIPVGAATRAFVDEGLRVIRVHRFGGAGTDDVTAALGVGWYRRDVDGGAWITSGLCAGDHAPVRGVGQATGGVLVVVVEGG